MQNKVMSQWISLDNLPQKTKTIPQSSYFEHPVIRSPLHIKKPVLFLSLSFFESFLFMAWRTLWWHFRNRKVSTFFQSHRLKHFPISGHGEWSGESNCVKLPRREQAAINQEVSVWPKVETKLTNNLNKI